LVEVEESELTKARRTPISHEDVVEISNTIGAVLLTEDEEKMVAILIAIGEPYEQVARKMKLDKHSVQLFLKSADGIEQIIRVQTSMFPDPSARIKKIANLAIDAQLRLLLRGSSDAVTAKVAQDILDRSMGKATQVAEIRNLTINVTDLASADRALSAQQERLARLEALQNKLLVANGGIT